MTLDHLDHLVQWCSAAGSLWIASVWQGLALALAASGLLRVFPRIAAREQYRLWLALYAACALLPLAEALGHAVASPAAVPAVAAGATDNFAPLALNSNWSLLLAGVWAAASAFLIVRLLAGLAAVRRLLRTAAPAPAIETDHAAILQSTQRGAIRVLTSPTLVAPVATGYRKPAIVLPAALLQQLTNDQMGQVLRHEAEHLRRRDDWATLLTAAARCVLPLHPAMLWMEKHLADTREMACDDAVLAAAPARDYAASLAQIATGAEAHRRMRLVPGLLGGRSQLAGRIEHILAKRVAVPRWPLPVAVAGLGVVFGVLLQSPTLVAFQTMEPVTAPTETATAPAFAEQPTYSQSAHVVNASLPVHRHPVHTRAATPRPAPVAAATREAAPELASLAPALNAPEPKVVLARAEPLNLHPETLFVMWTAQSAGEVTALVLSIPDEPEADAPRHPTRNAHRGMHRLHLSPGWDVPIFYL